MLTPKHHFVQNIHHTQTAVVSCLFFTVKNLKLSRLLLSHCWHCTENICKIIIIDFTISLHKMWSKDKNAICLLLKPSTTALLVREAADRRHSCSDWLIIGILQYVMNKKKGLCSNLVSFTPLYPRTFDSTLTHVRHIVPTSSIKKFLKRSGMFSCLI